VADWYPAEHDRAGPEHFDPAYVAAYDAKTQLDLDAALELLRDNGLGSDTTLVDLGCGTGLLAAAVSTEARRVIGVDVSPAMLDVARGRSDKVEWVEAGFLTYEHVGEPPQLLHSRNALHHLPDFWKGLALARVHDLVAPYGALVLHDLVYDFEPVGAAARVEEWLAGAAPSPAEGWTRGELETHARQEHSTFTWLLEPLLAHTGFEILERDVRGGIYATYICRPR
jgi:SAM-dependent methyltransferase